MDSPSLPKLIALAGALGMLAAFASARMAHPAHRIAAPDAVENATEIGAPRTAAGSARREAGPEDAPGKRERRLPEGAPAALGPAIRALAHAQFAQAERAARALLAGLAGDREAHGWAEYTLGEAVWAQGRLPEAQSIYTTFLREHPTHRAAPNARAALGYLKNWPYWKGALAERRGRS